MMRRCFLISVVALLSALPAVGAVDAGDEAPGFVARDIKGNVVDLDKIVQGRPDMVILFFFTTESGEAAALKLRRLDMLYREKLKIVAVGFKEDEAALKTFAGDLGIEYFVVKDTPEVGAAAKYGPFDEVPLTLILTDQKRVHKKIEGSDDNAAELINTVAVAYFQQRKLEQAQRVAEEAVAAGESAKAAGETKAFALVAEGKLDAAQAEFGKIESKEGLAKVALEKGEYEKAVQLASEADSGYGDVVKGTALARSGKLEEAAAALESAGQKPAADWQMSEAANTLGRVKQEKGDEDAAIQEFEKALALDPYNVVALSNEGAAHRSKGDLKKAAETLEQAQSIRNDEMTALMLRQVQQEMSEAADAKRGELIQAQIKDLRERYEAMKAAGKDQQVDTWSSPQMAVAFLPSPQPQAVFFDRAGMDVVLRREIEGRLGASESVGIVEREVLDKLLQELQLGSSELANPATQLQLGNVMSARMLGFIDYAQMGPDVTMYVRLVDTETTAIAAQISKSIKSPADIPAVADQVAAEIVAKVVGARQLKGMVVDVATEECVINLGKRHGVKEGMRFMAFTEGPPIEAGGKVIGHKEAKVALLEVHILDEIYAAARIVETTPGLDLLANTKVKQVMAK